MEYSVKELKETYNTETGEREDSFVGFNPPTENYSKLPHEFIAAFHLINSLSEMKVVMYVLRHTWGFRDNEKKITIDEFMNGRKLRDRTRMDKGTGLSEQSVRNGIEQAIKDGFLEVEIDDHDKARIKKYYSLKMFDDQPSGYKSHKPEVKELDPRGLKDIPRTEKETIERNSRNSEGDVSWEELESATQGEPPIDLSSLKKKPNELDQISVLLYSVTEQCDFAPDQFNKMNKTLQGKYRNGAKIVYEDIHSGRYKWGELEEAVKHLRNGGGQKYRNVHCAPHTVAADISLYLMKKDMPTPVSVEQDGWEKLRSQQKAQYGF